MALIQDVLGDRRVLVTGHTGFKGSWLSLWLEHLGARVFGLSLPPPTTPSHFVVADIEQTLATSTIGDVRDLPLLLDVVSRVQPEVVFHLAAQPLVREGYRTPVETFTTNVLGTVNVLEAVRRHAPGAAVVVITSDKCYEETGAERPFREDDRLGGSDPYSASKASAEIVAASYRRSFDLRVATVRAGNVFGGGDWARDRIVVDAIEAVLAGRAVEMRNPAATRPFQHVLEPLHGYLALAANMIATADERWSSAWNLGPSDETAVVELVDRLCREAGGTSVAAVADPAAPREAQRLSLDASRARTELGWQPRWDLDEAVVRTVRWYRAWRAGASMREHSLADIVAYGALGSTR